MSDKLQDTRSTFRLFCKRLGRLVVWNGITAIQYSPNFKNSYLPRRIRFNLLAVAALIAFYYSRTRLRNQVGFVDEQVPPEKRIYNFSPKSHYSSYGQMKAVAQIQPAHKKYIF